jgi:DNA replication protein DnaC
VSDPKPLAAGLVQARAALDAAAGPSRVSPIADLDLDAMAAERDAGIAEQRASAWRTICPQRFHRATLDDLDGPVVRQIAEWREQHPRPNLVLTGPVGTGKTHAALAAVRDDYLVRGLGVRFLTIVEALDLLRPGGPDGAMDDLLDVPRLVLTDLGAERPTDWTAERLYALIDRRWMEERPVIADTNLEPGPGGPLCTHLGERTYSRLVGSDAVVVRLGGKDRRRG